MERSAEPACASTEDYSGKKWFFFCLAGFLLLMLVFFKNAWVCDDAYINFRSIEQLFSGNGPNWNPHERVQAYTSPLWYWLLALARVVSPDPFFNAIILSFVVTLLLCFFIYRQLTLPAAGLTFFILAASNAFVDFSTSGLENILCALLVAAGTIFTARAIENKDSDSSAPLAMIILALMPLCRHDLILFMLPLAVLLIFNRYKGNLQRLSAIMTVFLPLLIWSFFSLIYYGAIFPNTAYAKIVTGIPRLEMISQGFKYFLVSFQQDPITLLIIFSAIFAGIRIGSAWAKTVTVALVLDLVYVVWIGGDFMRGRFFTSAFVMATVFLMGNTKLWQSFFCARKVCKGAVLIYIVYLVLFPFTPLNTGLSYSNFNLEQGIADERGYYFDVCSLYAYLYSKPGEVFPDFEWSHIGRQIAQSKVNYLENDFNGMLGYWAGTDKIIIDRLALADPFLARIPVASTTEWRIGHFRREVPEDYRKSIEAGQNNFPPGQMRNLYDLVSLAARGNELFTYKRFVAILRLNLGVY
jgi:arabinofuranosyltransferase